MPLPHRQYGLPSQAVQHLVHALKRQLRHLDAPRRLGQQVLHEVRVRAHLPTAARQAAVGELGGEDAAGHDGKGAAEAEGQVHYELGGLRGGWERVGVGWGLRNMNGTCFT